MYEEFMESIYLAKITPFNEESDQILTEKALNNYEIIKARLNYSTKEFKEHFKKS